MKICIDCGPKPESQFSSKGRVGSDGLANRCNKCLKDRNARYRKTFLSNPSNVVSLARSREKWISKNPDHDSRRHKATRRTLRSELLLAYGAKCSCCGESEEAFLTLEHRNRDGAAHRRSVGRAQVYADLKKRGWPKDKYTLFCMNCNWATRHGVECPHVKKMVPEMTSPPTEGK